MHVVTAFATSLRTLKSNLASRTIRRTKVCGTIIVWEQILTWR